MVTKRATRSFDRPSVRPSVIIYLGVIFEAIIMFGLHLWAPGLAALSVRGAALKRHSIDAGDDTIAQVISQFDTNNDGVLQRDEMPAGGFQGFVSAVRELEREKLRQGPLFTNRDEKDLRAAREEQEEPEDDGPLGWAKNVFDSFMKGDK